MFEVDIEFIDDKAVHAAIMRETKRTVRAFHKRQALSLAAGFQSSLPGNEFSGKIGSAVKKVGQKGSRAGWFARQGVGFDESNLPVKKNKSGKPMAPHLPAYHEFGGYGNRKSQGDFGGKATKEPTRAGKGDRFYFTRRSGIRGFFGGKKKHFTGKIKGNQFLEKWIRKRADSMLNSVGALYKTAFFQSTWLMIKADSAKAKRAEKQRLRAEVLSG